MSENRYEYKIPCSHSDLPFLFTPILTIVLAERLLETKCVHYLSFVSTESLSSIICCLSNF